MRLLVQAREGATDWAPDGVDFDESFRIVQRLRKNVIAISSATEIAEAIALLEAADLDSQCRVLLADALTRTALSRPDGAALPDVLLSRDVHESSSLEIPIERLGKAAEVEMLLDELTPKWVGGELREALFDLTFGRLLASASKVVVCDRWASANIGRGRRSGAAWFVPLLLRSGVPTVEILSMHGKHSRDGRPAPHPSEVLSTLPLDRSPRTLTRVEYVSIDADTNRRIVHDRHLKFIFDGGTSSEAVGLGKGAEVFARKVLEDEFNVHHVDEDTALKRENRIRRAPDRVVATWNR